MFNFNFRKTLQAAGVLFREQYPANEMEILRLIKLLYIADRECLREIGAPITGDRIVAMKHGPVLSKTYDILKGESIQSDEWEKYFKTINYTIKQIQPTGVGSLSKFEIKKLKDVHRRFEGQEEWDIVRETHQFAEWKKNDPGESSQEITYEDILSAVGREADIDSIRKNARALSVMDKIMER